MKIRSFIAFVILGGLLLSAAPMAGKNVKASNRFADKRAINARVTNKHSLNEKVSVYHGIVATLSAVYYNGDNIQIPDMIQARNFAEQLGGSLALNYKMTLNVYVSMRFGVQGALLRGDNTKAVNNPNVKNANSIHKFQSTVVSPFVGVEVYPIRNYGFFLYAGFGFPVSFINYEHFRNKTYTGSVNGFIPTAQLGLGYNWWLTPDWTLGIEFLGQIGMGDGYTFGMDGWPIDQAYNVKPDTPKENWPNDYKKAKDPDGWGQLGLVVSYHF